MEEDFENMWKLSSKLNKPKPPPKPVRVPTKKPTEAAAAARLPVPPGQRAQRSEVKIDAMGEVDILKYIQENESVGSEEPSLFWTAGCTAVPSGKHS